MQKKLAKISSPEINLVVSRPPYQGFSVAVKRNPNATRNLLFKQFIKLVAKLQLWYVVIENVPGILTIKKSAVKESIFNAFE